MPNLSILHWNDAYRVREQKINTPEGSYTMGVAQFAALLEDLRARWPTCEDGTRDGLVLFSGDVFSPSVESSVTRGSHMVPVMNLLAPDVALTGNHDFDFGYPHLSKLIEASNFPWILSNIVDEDTGLVPKAVTEFQIFEKSGLRIGVIGLVEEEWIETIPSWPPQFKYTDMATVGERLSEDLRKKHNCDVIIALSHCRIPNDIKLAREINARSPSAQKDNPVYNVDGVDLVLGGHDHEYYVSNGVNGNDSDVNNWEGYTFNKDADDLDVLVVKSGTDFRDLTEINLEFKPSPEGSVRKYVVEHITGVRHTVRDYRSSKDMDTIVDGLLSSVGSTMKAPVCVTKSVLDCRSQFLRTLETGAANWFADVLRHAYDDALCMKKDCNGADGVIICAGTLRGDSEYGPGVVTLGDIMEILPFGDPVVVLELDGAAIWGALQSSLSKWPAQEGRFPTISGLRVLWDSRKPPNERVQDIRLADGEEVKNTTEGRKYKIVTRNYLAQGNDGFDDLAGHPFLVDEESGQPMSTIVRKYLLGSHFVKKMAKSSNPASGLLSARAQNVISRAQEGAAEKWRHGASLAAKWAKAQANVKDHLVVCGTEHMSAVDPFDGARARKGNPSELVVNEEPDEDLLVIDPEIDDRLKDIARAE